MASAIVDVFDEVFDCLKKRAIKSGFRNLNPCLQNGFQSLLAVDA